VCLFAGVGAAAAAERSPKRIILIGWYGREATPIVVLDNALKGAVRAAPPATLEHYAEYLEGSRFRGEDESRMLRDYLVRKYASRPMDVVVAQTQPVLSFLLKYRAALFPDAAIVFNTVTRPVFDDPAVARRATGVIADTAYRKTLDLALALHPDTREVLVIASTLDGSKQNERMFQRQLAGFDRPVTVTYLSDLPLDQLLAAVKRAPKQSIILFIRHSRDQPIGRLPPRDVVNLIERSTSVPIYGPSSTFIGYGSIGGYAFDIQAAANTVARMALDVAQDIRPEDIPVTAVASVPKFDARQFRQATFWQTYGKYAVLAATIFLVETVLLAALLIQRAMRRRAERDRERAEDALRTADEALRNSDAHARDLAGRLIAAQEAERKRIALDLHDDLSQKLALLSIDIDQLDRSSRAEAPYDLSSRLHDISARAGEIASDVHGLSHQLHPSKLEVLGLSAATQGFCREISTQYDVAIVFEVSDVPRIVDPEVALCAFRIVQEAVHNVVKHSGAREAHVSLSRAGDDLDLRIADTGRGFLPSECERTGLGLVSMRERVHYVGGTLMVHSAPGRGTRIGVRIPLRQAVARGAA
jgi:signal transduction histidine kinase